MALLNALKTTSLRVKITFVSLALLFFAIFIYNGKFSLVRSVGCGASCSVKEIGTIDGLGNFSATTSLIKDQPYWVRLTINGEDNLPAVTPTPVVATPAPKGVDTMLMLDMSSSMGLPYPKNSPDDGTTVLEYQAAQAALNKYIDLSDQVNDYLGFGSFLYCYGYNVSATPIWWSYDDYNRADGRLRGFNTIHIPLTPINSNPNYFKGIINSLKYASNGYVDYCKSGGLSSTPSTSTGMFITDGDFRGGTAIGGAITSAATQLSPILADPDAIRSDGTSLRDSLLSKTLSTYRRNMGPYARQYTTGVMIPKYIILASDGDEGSPPLVDDIDIDKNTRTIVMNAKYYGIKIFMAVTMKQTSLSTNTKNRIAYIINNTGGKAYYGASQQELVNNFSAIRNDIVVDSGGGAVPTPTPVAKTNVKVTERVTLSYFKIDEPKITSPATFKVSQPGTPETDITSIMCKDANADGVPDCISNKKYDGSGNLIGYDVTLDPLSFGQSRYIYFRVTPIKSTNGSSIKVDDDTVSIINYSDIPHTPTLNNVSVTISNPPPFFQIYGGADVYSASSDASNSIKSTLPNTTDIFASSGNSVTIHKGGASYGKGVANSKNQDISYNLNDAPINGYQSLYNEYSNLIPSANIKTISGLSSFTTSGYYIDSGSQSSGKYVITGAGWTGLTLTGKKVVMFVPGDLYINTNFSIAKDGSSLLMFIVKGRVGIDPAVTSVQGVYLVDGTIDTACTSSIGFGANNRCLPDAGAAGLTTQLTLEGVFGSNSLNSSTGYYNGSIGGFILDRNPSTAIPGEKFIFRPDFLLPSTVSIGRKSYTWMENIQ